MSATTVQTVELIIDGVQTLVIVLAAIAGGVWAAYTFHVARQDRKFEVEEQKSKRRAVLNLGLEVNQLDLGESDKRLVWKGVASVENVGARAVTVVLGETPFALVELVTPGDREGVAGETVGCSAFPCVPGNPRLAYHNRQLLEPGQRVEYLAVSSVDTPGLYELSFRVSSSEAEIKDAEARLQPAPDGEEALIDWSVDRVFVVDERAAAREVSPERGPSDN